MKKTFLILVFLIISVFYINADVVVKATADSSVVLMGKKVALEIEVLKNGNDHGYFTLDFQDLKKQIIPNTNEIELCDVISSDSINLGNKRSQITINLLIQPWQPGLNTIPPFVYVNGVDTFCSNEITLKVLPIDVDTTKVPIEIKNYASVESIPSKWYDFLPDFVVDYWYLILTAIIIIIGIVIIVILWRKNGSLIVYKKKRIPPYELAMRQLKKLHEESLCEKGREREYYTRLPEIIREYLKGRFGINAIEMTSTQINCAVSQYKEPLPSHYIYELLEISDFVKFAKVKPTTDENVKAYNNAFSFVEETKPVIENEDETLNVKSSQQTKKNRNNKKTKRTK